MKKIIIWTILIIFFVTFILILFSVIKQGIDLHKQRVNFCKEFGFKGIKDIRDGYASNHKSCYKIENNEIVLREIDRHEGKFYFVNGY